MVRVPTDLSLEYDMWLDCPIDNCNAYRADMCIIRFFDCGFPIRSRSRFVQLILNGGVPDSMEVPCFLDCPNLHPLHSQLIRFLMHDARMTVHS